MSGHLNDSQGASTWYPDTHPDVRENVVTLTLPGGERRQYMPRSAWEDVVRERDQLRKTIGLVGVWRLATGTTDQHLASLLESVGETDETSRTLAGIIAWAKSANGQEDAVTTPESAVKEAGRG